MLVPWRANFCSAFVPLDFFTTSLLGLLRWNFYEYHQIPPKYPKVRSDQNPGLFWHFHVICLQSTFRSGSSLLGFTPFCYSIVTPPPAAGACYVGPLESPNVRHQNPGWLGYIGDYTIQ